MATRSSRVRPPARQVALLHSARSATKLTRSIFKLCCQLRGTPAAYYSAVSGEQRSRWAAVGVGGQGQHHRREWYSGPWSSRRRAACRMTPRSAAWYIEQHHLRRAANQRAVARARLPSSDRAACAAHPSAGTAVQRVGATVVRIESGGAAALGRRGMTRAMTKSRAWPCRAGRGRGRSAGSRRGGPAPRGLPRGAPPRRRRPGAPGRARPPRPASGAVGARRGATGRTRTAPRHERWRGCAR